MIPQAWSAPFLSWAAGAVAFLKGQIRSWLNNCVTLVTATGMLPRSAITRGFTQVRPAYRCCYFCCYFPHCFFFLTHFLSLSLSLSLFFFFFFFFFSFLFSFGRTNA